MNRHRILVAFDGSEESFWALKQAADAAERGDAELGVVTVMPESLDTPRDALRYLRECGLDGALHVLVGDPAIEIAKVADDGAYHTVYLGTRDGPVARALARALAPGAAHQVALRAPTSVVTRTSPGPERRRFPVRRRPHRSKVVQRLVSPVATKVQRRIPRIRRQFPPMQLRWTLGRRLLTRPAGRLESGEA